MECCRRGAILRSLPLVILSLALLPGWLSRVVFLVGITWFAAEYLSQYRIDMLNVTR